MSVATVRAETALEDDPRAALLSLVSAEFAVERGHPLPLGATLRRRGINFAVVSAHASWVSLILYPPGSTTPAVELPLDPCTNRTGDVWHAFVAGLDPGVEYAFRAGREPQEQDETAKPETAPPVHRFDPRCELLDPFAKAVAGAAEWGGQPPPGARIRPRRARAVDDDFDWEFDQPLNRHLADSVIYELHVRGFTADASSGVKSPGTFRGLAEKVPYLAELGVTAIELLPVTEFEESDSTLLDPATGERLRNLWGYQPLALFAPRSAYAATGAAGGEVGEFKTLVKTCHRAGIEVILDLVFNHTGEGSEAGPTVSLRGLDNSIYYMVDPATGSYLDFSGCGNTLNCNHPVMRNLVLSCLRYWVTEMHVDGFRFDLASVLGRGRDGAVLSNPPLLEMIAGDPVLAHTKLIAEAWDAAGLYQVGSFPNWGRWAEWNGRFRDDLRRFLRGEPGTTGSLATRLAGSADLYQGGGREPFHSVNFVTSHDGFTLADLVSYEHKHNLGNGEQDRDGDTNNLSWNCGAEGPTGDPSVRALRSRQRKTFLLLLLAAQGVPMLLAGDERGRSQRGNNNAYCQDNEISWLTWELDADAAELLRFTRGLLAFRRRHASLRRRDYGEGERWVHWQGRLRDTPDWSPESRCLGMHLPGGNEADVMVLANSDSAAVLCELPLLADRHWRLAADSAQPAPADLSPDGSEPLLAEPFLYLVAPHSAVLLVGR